MFKNRVRPPALADIVAGLSVALVLIPQAMAYAELAGLPPQVGLFAAALPPLIAAPFVSSPHLQTGPVALTGLLTFGALQGLAEPFSSDYIELAIVLALLVGLFRVTLGLLRLGSLAYLLSNPVLVGFTTGAAVLIVASQLPQVFGTQHLASGVLAAAATALRQPETWAWSSILFATATVAVMKFGRYLHPLFPSVLLAVVGGTAISAAVGFSGNTIGPLPGGFIHLRTSFAWGSVGELLVPAAAIALVGFAEPSSIARSFAAQDRQRWNANREMVGQGVANLASAFSGGLPVGGSFSRSALGRLAGGTSRWTGAVAGLAVLCTLPLAPLAKSLPRSVLAAIVITSVFRLINVRAIAKLFRESAPQGVVALGTLLATLTFAPRVERGVFVGVALAVAVHLYRELNITTCERVDGSTLTIRPKGVLWFATVPKIERIVRSNLADDPAIETVRLDLGGVGRLDYTGAATLKQSIVTLTSAGVTVEIDNVPPGAERAAGIHLDAELFSHQRPHPTDPVPTDPMPPDPMPTDRDIHV